MSSTSPGQTAYQAPAMVREREMVPRFLLRLMFGLVVASLMLVTFARLTNRPLEATPPQADIIAERVLVIAGDMSGSATVHDADGNLVMAYGVNEGGFVAGVHRALTRERAKYGVPADAAVHLTQYADGRLALIDPETGWTAQLRGFGDDNYTAFLNLMSTQQKAR